MAFLKDMFKSLLPVGHGAPSLATPSVRIAQPMPIPPSGSPLAASVSSPTMEDRESLTFHGWQERSIPAVVTLKSAAQLGGGVALPPPLPDRPVLTEWVVPELPKPHVDPFMVAPKPPSTEVATLAEWAVRDAPKHGPDPFAAGGADDDELSFLTSLDPGEPFRPVVEVSFNRGMTSTPLVEPRPGGVTRLSVPPAEVMVPMDCGDDDNAWEERTVSRHSFTGVFSEDSIRKAHEAQTGKQP